MLNELIKNKSHCAFVSPHFDDAVFSAGGLINKLVEGGCKVTIINVFTQTPHKYNTLSAKAYLKQCGYEIAGELYKARTEEDRKVLTNMGCNIINLGFIEALWRQKQSSGFLYELGKILPEINSLYPTYRLHIIKGNIHKKDKLLIEIIADRIGFLTNTYQFDTIFAPIGIGNHIDHIVVNEAIKTLKTESIFWEDFPYSVNSQAKVSDYKSEEVLPDWNKKLHLMKMYESQFDAIFKQIPPSKQEVYFYK